MESEFPCTKAVGLLPLEHRAVLGSPALRLYSVGCRPAWSLCLSDWLPPPLLYWGSTVVFSGEKTQKETALFSGPQAGFSTELMGGRAQAINSSLPLCLPHCNLSVALSTCLHVRFFSGVCFRKARTRGAVARPALVNACELLRFPREMKPWP